MKPLQRICNLLRRCGGTRPTDAKAHFHTAILLAAGNGARMGGSDAKQFLPLAGKPVIVHTLQCFQSCPYIREIVLVVRAQDAPVYDGYRKEYRLTKLKKIVEGGESRQISAMRGFYQIDPACDYISIHDGARCLLTVEQLSALIRTAYAENGAVAAATPAKDTVKIVDAAHRVVKTPDRATVWLAQTPQIFPVSFYEAALAVAQRDAITVTDDCSLAEYAGFSVHLLDCGSENLKITTPDDLELAQIILARRAQSAEQEAST